MNCAQFTGIVTELNYKKLERHGPQVFKEAPPAKPVTIHSVERVDCSQLPIIALTAAVW